jgi:hypothetical protein
MMVTAWTLLQVVVAVRYGMLSNMFETLKSGVTETGKERRARECLCVYISAESDGFRIMHPGHANANSVDP